MTNNGNRNNKLSFALLALALTACSVAPIDETVADWVPWFEGFYSRTN